MAKNVKEIESILAKSRKYITFSERGYILNYIFDLLEENRYFLRQIDKAIEYLKSISMDKTSDYIPLKDYKEYNILLKILRGDDLLDEYRKEKEKK